jgi:hypothetical protein
MRRRWGRSLLTSAGCRDAQITHHTRVIVPTPHAAPRLVCMMMIFTR